LFKCQFPNIYVAPFGTGQSRLACLSTVDSGKPQGVQRVAGCFKPGLAVYFPFEPDFSAGLQPGLQVVIQVVAD
jgi:hypothetical protein